MLSLPEKLMLLALNDEKGSIIFSASTALPYGLAGSIILELLFQNKLTLNNKKIEILDESPIEDPLLNKAISLIKESNRERDVKHWVHRLERKLKGLKTTIIERLIAKEILRKEKNKFLWVIPVRHYPMSNVAPEQEIRTRIHQIILQNDTPTQQDIALLSLIKGCGLFNEVFKKEDRKIAKKRIKEIVEKERIGEAVSAVVTEITAAVTTAIIAASVASSSSN
jgi:hypothetical protein